LDEFQLLLSICAASLDVEAVDPNSLGKETKKVRNNFLYNDNKFKMARDAMGRLSVMCNHIARSLPAAAAAVDDFDEV
jgi:hypothetical protein